MNSKLFRLAVSIIIIAQLFTLGCSGGCGKTKPNASSGSSGSGSGSTASAAASSNAATSSSSSTTCTTLGNSTTGSGALCTQPQDTVQTPNVTGPALTTPETPSPAAANPTSGFTTISHIDWAPEPLAQEYMSWFLNQSQDPKLNLYVPGYAYYQGALYSKGKTQIVGPVRVIGGVYSEGSGTTKLQKGAMITTDTEYLEGRNGFNGFSQGKNKFHVSEWEELPNN